jgi:ABC-type multidrug transport system ATPase subunit
MEEIRKMTGICPQHDVLFDELSPREHLQFFARIRVHNAHLNLHNKRGRKKGKNVKEKGKRGKMIGNWKL